MVSGYSAYSGYVCMWFLIEGMNKEKRKKISFRKRLPALNYNIIPRNSFAFILWFVFNISSFFVVGVVALFGSVCHQMVHITNGGYTRKRCHRFYHSPFTISKRFHIHQCIFNSPLCALFIRMFCVNINGIFFLEALFAWDDVIFFLSSFLYICSVFTVHMQCMCVNFSLVISHIYSETAKKNLLTHSNVIKTIQRQRKKKRINRETQRPKHLE